MQWLTAGPVLSSGVFKACGRTRLAVAENLDRDFMTRYFYSEKFEKPVRYPLPMGGARDANTWKPIRILLANEVQPQTNQFSGRAWKLSLVEH
ncbi:hypothetical protein ACMFWY_14950 [Roseiconus sp. JC912]|uniref:hypothetical protein n=1 Tax=Roseiconus sp. JC912 TaxID=3396307 RepID=UPI003A4C60F2